MSVDMANSRALNSLLDELDTKAQQEHVARQNDDPWVCQRRHPRYPFRAKCIVRFLPAGSTTMPELPGRTRNLSRSGVSFLVRRVFGVGEAVELEIHPPQRSDIYMAGLVQFCRYAGQGHYEVGVALKAVQSTPIFFTSLMMAMHSLDWLRPEMETG